MKIEVYKNWVLIFKIKRLCKSGYHGNFTIPAGALNLDIRQRSYTDTHSDDTYLGEWNSQGMAPHCCPHLIIVHYGCSYGNKV